MGEPQRVHEAGDGEARAAQHARIEARVVGREAHRGGLEERAQEGRHVEGEGVEHEGLRVRGAQLHERQADALVAVVVVRLGVEPEQRARLEPLELGARSLPVGEQAVGPRRRRGVARRGHHPVSIILLRPGREASPACATPGALAQARLSSSSPHVQAEGTFRIPLLNDVTGCWNTGAPVQRSDPSDGRNGCYRRTIVRPYGSTGRLHGLLRSP